MSACLSDTRTSAAGSPYNCRQGRPRLIMRVATLISFSLRPNVGGCETCTPSATHLCTASNFCCSCRSIASVLH
jgi:hypothetical protein